MQNKLIRFTDMNDRQKAAALDGLVEAREVTAKDAELALDFAIQAAQGRARRAIAEEFAMPFDDDGPVATASTPVKEVRSAKRSAKSTKRKRGEIITDGGGWITNAKQAVKPVRRENNPATTAAAVAGRAASATLTPEQVASRKLQGLYISKIRQVPETRKPGFQRIVKAEGREAAIKAIDAYLLAKRGGGADGA